MIDFFSFVVTEICQFNFDMNEYIVLKVHLEKHLTQSFQKVNYSFGLKSAQSWPSVSPVDKIIF